MNDYNNALDYSTQWLGIIRQENSPDVTQAKWIIEQSTQNFAEHFNRGWLEYRKSVTEAGDWASVEWSGNGSAFTDVMGRKYIDWLGMGLRLTWAITASTTSGWHQPRSSMP